MMKATAKKWILSLCFLFISAMGFAQEQAEMADVMRSNGKIYVVVAVLMVVLMGLIFYVIALDKKIRKLEKNSDIKS
ncbi:MAG TPA: CcmD family protein [Ferruginibacter sp.]|nr:CcmD family protein [Ferruginibacter sp.]HRQ21688.1 CcmD family protein [Ferruginibacter sp.]